VPLNLTKLQRKAADALVKWTDPSDNEQIEFSVTYAPHRYSSRLHNELGRLQSTANEAKAALEGSEEGDDAAEADDTPGVTLDEVFDALLNVLGGKPGKPDSGLVLDWDVIDSTGSKPVKIQFSRDVLEGFPLDLLFAITGAIMGDVGNRRRGDGSASS